MTCLGIDNTGDYVFTYGKEDTDYYVDGDPSSNYVFRVADSVFFCRLRDLFHSEMQAMFKDREEKNAWLATSLIEQWDNSQSLFPEELWRLDYERKYYRTYLGLSIDSSITKGIDKTFLIGKFFGRKKYARRAFEINQEVYFATKYFGNSIRGDEKTFWIRGSAHDNANYSLTLVPYSDMYVCVQYGSTGTPIHKKTKAGETCVFESDAKTMDFIYVYAADYIQEVGDLSRCYVSDNSFTAATRLQKLVIGSNENGYENTFMKNVLVGNNPLLEYLDIRNISGINEVINLSGCGNLKELYAEGTNASGVIFANGGLLHTAHIPNVTSLSMKNLNYIEDFDIDGYSNLQTLIVENTPNVNTYDMVINAPLLKSLRLIGMDWDSSYNIENASVFDRLLTIGGIDSSGIETDLSMLTGHAHVAVIKEQQSNNYKIAWPDLNIEWSTRIEQIPVTFVNYDGTVLEIQYVDKGSYAVDPTERVDNTMPVPTKESTVSHEYIFNGWSNFPTGQVHTAYTVTATYEESLRKYTVRYMLSVENEFGQEIASEELYSNVGEYGTDVPYEGNTPTYVAQESGYTYYLFNRWDKSGFVEEGKDGTDLVNGVKTIKTKFDRYHYNGTSDFAGKKLSDLAPVQIYALSKLTEKPDETLDTIGMSVSVLDDYSFTMGYDVDFDDVDSELIIDNKVYLKENKQAVFDGSTVKFDTGINLFDEDKDFVLAMDYKMFSGNNSNAVLMQCFQTAGKNGFTLSSGTNAQITWGGSSSVSAASIDSREMLVIRHVKGDNNLYVYTSNINSMEIGVNTLNKASATQSDISTLVFGASKLDSGRFDYWCKGEVNWCKIWYKDLGDDICRKLVGWTHEEISLEVSGFYRYQLSDDFTKESMISLLGTHLLEGKRQYDPKISSTNVGGWKEATLNKYLNTRFYNAIPNQIKALIKKVSVGSTSGGLSKEPIYSDCYVTIPAVCDLFNPNSYKTHWDNMGVEVYGNSCISFMVTDEDRKRSYPGSAAPSPYWTRSPNLTYSKYNHYINDKGKLETVGYEEYGVLIEISF